MGSGFGKYILVWICNLYSICYMPRSLQAANICLQPVLMCSCCAQLSEFKSSGQPTYTAIPSNDLEGIEIKTLLHFRKQIVELSCVETPQPIHTGAAASHSLQIPPSHPQACPAWPQKPFRVPRHRETPSTHVCAPTLLLLASFFHHLLGLC